jgi:hypothetical protein
VTTRYSTLAVRLAVAELHHRHRQIPPVQDGDGRWILAVGNSGVRIDEHTMAHSVETAPELVEQLRGEVSNERVVLDCIEMLLTLLDSEE